MEKELLQNLLYFSTTDTVKSYLKDCNDSEVIYVFAFNYNWEDGFEIPTIIVNNPACTISTAKLLFWRADGANFLNQKLYDPELPEWSNFIVNLYEKIKFNKFKADNFQFNLPLTKIQKYKLSKKLSVDDLQFIEDIPGKNLDIEI